MIVPTLQEVITQANDLGLSPIEAEKFYNYYQSNGWMVGRSKMKKWVWALRNWKLKCNEFGRKTEFSYSDVVAIHNDPRDRRTMAMFQRTNTGSWVERQ